MSPILVVGLLVALCLASLTIPAFMLSSQITEVEELDDGPNPKLGYNTQDRHA